MQARFSHKTAKEEILYLIRRLDMSDLDRADREMSIISGLIIWSKKPYHYRNPDDKEVLAGWLGKLEKLYLNHCWTATLQFAWEHFEGRFLQKNDEKGIAILKGLAEREDIYGYEVIGQAYYEKKILPVDYQKAFYYMTVAGEERSSQTTDYLADMYYRGLWVEEDHKKAAELWEKIPKGIDGEVIPDLCAKAGDRLYDMYRRGDGVEQDLMKAEYYKEMADHYHRCLPLQVHASRFSWG